MQPNQHIDWQPVLSAESGPLPKVQIGVVNYNRKDAIIRTLEALAELDYPDYEVLMVDNHSTDGAYEYVQENFPHVRTIRFPSNLGVNVARNRVITEARTKYVLVMDNDIVLEPDALTRLVRIMQKVPQAGMVHVETKDAYDRSAQLHYNGGWIHYLMAVIPRTYPSGERPEYEFFDTVSGSAVLVDKEIAGKVDGFDEDLFFGWTDGDFALRMRLAGYRVMNAPYAVGYHYGRPRELSMAYYQVRNRWYLLIKLYSLWTIIVLAPALFLYELSLMAVLLINKRIGDYFRGTFHAWRDLPMLLPKRRKVQRMKVLRDKEWLKAGEIFVPKAILQNNFLRPLFLVYNGILNLYWKIFRPLIG